MDGRPRRCVDVVRRFISHDVTVLNSPRPRRRYGLGVGPRRLVGWEWISESGHADIYCGASPLPPPLHIDHGNSIKLSRSQKLSAQSIPLSQDGRQRWTTVRRNCVVAGTDAAEYLDAMRYRDVIRPAVWSSCYIAIIIWVDIHICVALSLHKILNTPLKLWTSWAMDMNK